MMALMGRRGISIALVEKKGKLKCVDGNLEKDDELELVCTVILCAMRSEKRKTYHCFLRPRTTTEDVRDFAQDSQIRMFCPDLDV